MLLGGGITPKQANLFLKFAGENKPIIIIPTAFSNEKIKKDPDFKKLKNRFMKLGIGNVKILHTQDRDMANSNLFIEQIKNANGVFFMGGRTQNIVDVYVDTKVHLELSNLLKRGGIIAGVSAGSGVQANFFDSDNNIIKGFQFLKDVVVMNHFFKKNKQFDHIEKIKSNRNLLAIGIDDNTAIFFNNGTFEVVGNSYVALYDCKNYSRNKDSIYNLPKDTERFYVLQNGDRYNIKKREVISNARLNHIDLDANEYSGSYKSISKDYGFNCFMVKDTLYLKNSWGWKPYPIFPYKKDIFFAKNRTMWFKFKRDSITNKIIGAEKMKSILQENVIAKVKRI
jgi:cyanophycinase